jgi:hypothetical protein
MLVAGDVLFIESPPAPLATPFSKAARAYLLKSGELFAIVPSFCRIIATAGRTASCRRAQSAVVTTW